MPTKSTPKTRSSKWYGWRPDLPDHRDHIFKSPSLLHRMALTVSKPVDLRPGCPPVYDQGDLGSCTANAIGALFQFVQKMEKAKDFTPSRLFIYYNERAIEGDVPYDNGAQIRDGIKSVHKQGVCPETMWPYNIQDFAKKPSDTCYAEATGHQSIEYLRILHTLCSMKACLKQGFPFVFGFTVYESFESDEVAKTGMMPMPKKGEEQLGGHAVMAVGYDDSKKAMLIRNSWGTDWGVQGYFWMPYDFIKKLGLSSDFWTIRKVEV